MFKKHSVLLVLLFSVLTLHSYAQADIRLYPARVFFYTQDGMIQQKSVHIINKSNKTITCSIDLMDWNRDSIGMKKYYVLGFLSSTVKEMLSTNIKTIQLAPNEEKDIMIDLKLNNKNISFKNSMLFITQMDTDSTQKGIKILAQLGIHLYITNNKYLDKQLIVSDANIQKTEKGKTLKFNVHNKTKGVIDTDIKSELQDENGKTIEISKKLPISTMPNDKYTVQIPFTKMNMQNHAYKIILYIDNGYEFPLQVIEIPYKS